MNTRTARETADTVSDIEASIAMALLMRGYTKSAHSGEAARLVMVACANIIGMAANPERLEEAEEVFGRLFAEALKKSISLKRVERDYPEFTVEGVAKRIMSGIKPSGREEEFAIGLNLIGPDGEAAEHLRDFFKAK